MKSGILNPVLLSILLVGFGSMVTSQASAQTFTTLHSFSNTAMDGASPFSNLVLSSNTLYGLAGGSVEGIIFAVNTDGTGFTNLYGYGFASSLILYGNTLYGAASTGGDSVKGAVFKLSTDGTGFSVLY